MKLWRKWTESERIQLKQLVKERKSAQAISDIMGRSLAAVVNAKKRLGLHKPMTLSPNEHLHIAEIIKFKMAGWNLEQIGKVYGLTESHVSSILVKNGLLWKRGKLHQLWSEYELHRLRKYCKKGYNLNRICTYFPNHSRKAVRARIDKMTRYWFTPEEKAERKRLRKKEMELRVY